MDSQRAVWTERAVDWRQHADSREIDPFYALVNRPAFLEMLPPPGRLTVEIGAGNGRFTAELLRLGHRVVATDIARDSLEAAVLANPDLPVVTTDAARLALRDGVADLVVAFMCLQDIDDIRRAISEASRLLAEGGTLCFSIVHPVRSAGAFASRDPDAPFVITDSYFEERRWEWMTVGVDGAQVNLPSVHRPVAAYMDALSDAGLVVERYVEPLPSAEAVAGRPWLERWLRVPCFLLVRASRRAPGLSRVRELPPLSGDAAAEEIVDDISGIASMHHDARPVDEGEHRAW